MAVRCADAAGDRIALRVRSGLRRPAARALGGATPHGWHCGSSAVRPSPRNMVEVAPTPPRGSCGTRLVLRLRLRRPTARAREARLHAIAPGIAAGCYRAGSPAVGGQRGLLSAFASAVPQHASDDARLHLGAADLRMLARRERIPSVFATEPHSPSAAAHRASRSGLASALPQHASGAALLHEDCAADRGGGLPPRLCRAAATQCALRSGFASAVPQHAGGARCTNSHAADLLPRRSLHGPCAPASPPPSRGTRAGALAYR
jgi:hypothetical protein